MNLRKILDVLLLERGAKKSDSTYYFIKPHLRIKDTESGYKYTVSKVKTDPEIIVQCYRSDIDGDGSEIIDIPWKEYKEKYERA